MINIITIYSIGMFSCNVISIGLVTYVLIRMRRESKLNQKKE